MAKRNLTCEEVCSAFLTHGTVKETAKVLGVSERTVYNKMSTDEFKEMYDYVQVGILNNAINVCQSKLIDAINCIADIMNDKTVNAQTRLQSAQTILKTSVSMYDSLSRRRDSADGNHSAVEFREKYGYD